MLVTPGNFGMDNARVVETAERLLKLKEEPSTQLAVVIGGGNIFRGKNLEEMGVTRTAGDQMGMLATLMNGLALKSALKKLGAKVRLFSALDCPKVAESFQIDIVQKALEEGYLTIFVGGTGSPYFTTDTAAALRAAEIGANFLVKATKVDGVYDKDPKEQGASLFKELTWDDFLARQLKVMDQTAVQICRNEKIPIFVFNMALLGETTLQKLMTAEQGTLIKG